MVARGAEPEQGESAGLLEDGRLLGVSTGVVQQKEVKGCRTTDAADGGEALNRREVVK
jgi:hypothetical protein